MARPRRGCGTVDYEPIPTCLSISGNTLIYETNTGEIKNITLPVGIFDWDPVTCSIKYVDENGSVVTQSLEGILLKSKDALIFDQNNCTLKYTSVNGDCEIWDVGAAIMAKLQDGLVWDQNDCELVYTNTSGQSVTHEIGEDVIDKLEYAVGWNAENCTLTWTNADGNGIVAWPIGFSILNKIETDITFDAESCSLKFTSPTGECKNFDLTAILDKLCIFTNLDFDPESCVLKFTNPAGQCSIWDLGAALADKAKCYVHEYDPDTHTITLIDTTSGNPVSTSQLNCGSLAWDGENCRLIYTNEKGFDQPVPLPIGLQGCTFNPNTRALTFIDSKGVETTKDLGSDSFTVDIGAGTFTHIDITGTPVTIDVCQLAEKCKPSMEVIDGPNEDGSKTFCFRDGYGNTTCCDIPAVTLDTDNVTVNGSTVTFMTGGDGNPGTVVFDVCAMVAQNCNATFTNINPDGSWSFIDNAGNTYNWSPVITTLVDNGDSFTYVSEDGTVSTVDKCCTNITEDADSYYITDHNGNIAEVCKNPVKDVVFNGVAYPPDASGSVVFNYEAPGTISNNGNGTATVVLPDGSTKTDVLCGTPSNVVPNAAGTGGGTGTATITQTDGTVKDDAVCGVQSTVAPNPAGVGGGTGTATITQNDGSVKDDAVCGQQSSVVPNTPGVGGGPGTATITQNDGSVKDDAVCGVQSTVVENPAGEDGSVTGTVTQNDGTTCDFLKEVPPIPDDIGPASTVVPLNPAVAQITQNDGSTADVITQLTDCNGNVIDPNVDQVVTGAEKIISSFGCVDGSMEVMYKDGTGLCFQPRLVTVFSGNNSGQQLVESTPKGEPLAATEFCRDIVLPKCGGSVDLLHIYGLSRGDFQPAGAFGRTQTTVQWSVDGGAWNSTQLNGGFDEANVGSGEPVGEFEFTDGANTGFLSGGPHTICFRISMFNHDLVNGASFGLNVQSAKLTWTEMVCCNPDGSMAREQAERIAFLERDNEEENIRAAARFLARQL